MNDTEYRRLLVAHIAPAFLRNSVESTRSEQSLHSFIASSSVALADRIVAKLRAIESHEAHERWNPTIPPRPEAPPPQGEPRS